MINMIAAAAANGVIGSNGKLPWDIPEDRAYFKRITMGGVVIMGRRTYEEIGSPLPGRYNIVVSSSRRFSGEMLMTTASLESALTAAENYISVQDPSAEIFLCGGEAIYRKGIGICEHIYLTRLDASYEGDAHFPDISDNDFRLVSCFRLEKQGLEFQKFDRKSGPAY